MSLTLFNLKHIEAINTALVNTKFQIKELKAKLAGSDGTFNVKNSSLIVYLFPLTINSIPTKLQEYNEMVASQISWAPHTKNFFYYEISDGVHTFFSKKFQCNLLKDPNLK